MAETLAQTRLRQLRTVVAPLFGLRARVDRKTYALVGFGLMATKYAIDASLIHFFTGEPWTPFDYLSPLFATRERTFGAEHRGLQVVLALWTLPFLWIGMSMTMRRAVDAGVSAWVGLVMYFVPFLNYAWMLFLCCLPSAQPVEHPREPVPASTTSLVLRAVAAVMVAVILVSLLFALSIFALRSYGSMLFLGSPVLLGATSAYFYDRGEQRPWREAIAVGTLSVLIGCGALLLFAFEGMMCLAMFVPIAIPMAVTGALIGRSLSNMHERPWGAAAMLPFGLASATWLEARVERPVPFAVTTTIEVNAPRELVWKHVVSFSELPPPTWWPFELGLAHPVRATIVGRGVGAVRHCEFSTGPFVEPITAWEEPTRLAFDVADEPASMHELSPWGQIQPPHLDHYFSSKRGEFRLVELPGERTRLEGTTWYELRFAPARYWRWWSDLIVHHIHGEVLAHVRRLAELDQR